MHDASSKIAFIQSRLPYIDRRALSEAWFSALHLASDGPPLRGAAERRGVSARAPLSYGTDGRRSAAIVPCVPRDASREARTTAGSRCSVARHDVVTPVAARAPVARAAAVARALHPPLWQHAPFSASLTLGLERGRVQLLLRREGATLHVVALCRPGAVETVRRALAFAHAHLRARGETVRSSVRPLGGAAVHA